MRCGNVAAKRKEKPPTNIIIIKDDNGNVSITAITAITAVDEENYDQ